jgi:uncharacterized protein
MMSSWSCRSRFGVALLILLAALGAATAGAEPLASIPNPRVRNGTWVTDTAGGLRADTVTRLNQVLGEAERTRGIEMAVVVVRSLDGLTIEDAAEKLFKLWGIGKKDRDNGLLLLWSTGDRKVRVEVGYGLEGVLPDGKVGALLDTYVIPRFKAGDFDAGVSNGVDAILAAAIGEPIALPVIGTESYDTPAPASWSLSLRPLWFALGGGIPVVIAAITAFRRWRRYRRRYCPQCRTRMRRLSESDDDALLEKAQVTEEQIGSVDYDVWTCPSCAAHLTLRYPKWLSTYDACPQCHNRTKSSTETVIERATTHGSGLAKVVERCAFCSFSHEYSKVLPQLTESSSSSSSSSGGSGGSSFGGGSSGGGGASRGY